MPGRTDNQVKNHWNTHLSKKLGIKKQNRKIVGNSKKHSTQVEQTCTLSTDSHSKHSSYSNAKVMEERQLENPLELVVDEASTGEAQWVGKHFADLSPLFPDDHQILDSPGLLLDFLDGNPFDLPWQSF